VGDIDGDGRRDRVTIRFAPQLNAECGIIVAVKTGRGVKAARLSYGSEAGKFPRTSDFIRLSTFPFLNGLYRLDRRGGFEIVVTSWEGASTSILKVFTFNRGRLVEVRPPSRDGLWWGGCCSGSTGLDCAAGMLRITSASPLADIHHFRVDRAFYSLRSARLTVIRKQSFRLSDGRKGFRQFSREAGAFFDSCQGVRAKRR
jgi:hypothetical protein